MKKWALCALCFFSSMAQANDIEEVVVVARQVRIVLLNIVDTHRYNPVTQKWYPDEKMEQARFREKGSRGETGRGSLRPSFLIIC